MSLSCCCGIAKLPFGQILHFDGVDCSPDWFSPSEWLRELKVSLDNEPSDDVSLDWEEDINANDGTKMKVKAINNMNKFIFTYFINESYVII